MTSSFKVILWRELAFMLDQLGPQEPKEQLLHVADARVRDLMAQVGQGALNPIVAPAGVLPGQTHDQLADLVGDGRTAGPLLSAVAVIPFLRDQPVMPAQDR